MYYIYLHKVTSPLEMLDALISFHISNQYGLLIPSK